MAWVAVGGTALSMVNASMQAEITLEQGETQRQINNMNADFEELDSYHALQQGQTNTARYQEQIDQTISSQRTDYASEGVAVNKGSAAEVQAETGLTGYLNKISLQNQARSTAYGLHNQAVNTRLGGQNAYESAAAAASQEMSTAEIQGLGSLGKAFENKYDPSKADLSGYDQ